MSGLSKRLDAFFAEKFPKVMEHGPDEYFADTGALSSLQTVRLALDLEEEFGVRVADEDMVEENLGSRDNILKYLEIII